MKQMIKRLTAKRLAGALFALACMGLMVLLSAHGASAAPLTLGTSDTYGLDTTPYQGVVGETGSYINNMISTYGVPAILISVAIGGWMFVKRVAKSAFH